MTSLAPSQIKDVLPHRPPTLLIDQVLNLAPGESITALKAITVEALCYEGVDGFDHSYPNALMLESFGQAAAVLLAKVWRPADGMGDEVPILGAMSGIHFDIPVQPGDVVQHQVYIDRIAHDNAIVHGFSTVGDTTVMRVEHIVLALRPRRQVQ